MGISGLLPLLKSIHKHTTLKKFAGQTIGIDGYGWLHRGAIACAIELALDKPTSKYIEFAVNRVRMLLDFGVTPYVVFDGDALPSKAGTNQERRKRREEAKKLGLSLYKAGKISQAYQELQKATAVTPTMARLLIEELKKMNVQYIVAPYEADAQLAYLEQKGIINGILSEDSDLLVFGAKRLITKLDQYGECVEIERKDFPLVREISLTGWTDAMFRRMAILSGCDYLPNIGKMGLKTAYRFVRKYKESEKVIRMVSFEGKLHVPQGYQEQFRDAELTFIHHRVFCPLRQEMVFLTDLGPDMNEDDLPFLGPGVDAVTAVGVACGDLNPKTKEPIEVSAPYSGRPSLIGTRRQTMGTPSELKSKKSIDTFFKPQRTPLQELDPNSLTPSPSQQRLLERNANVSWEARTISSAPQLQRAATASIPSSNTVRSDRQAFLARASTMSSYKPLKRQRLCSEGEVTPSKEIKQSPFFSSAAPSASPLEMKKLKSRKTKREFDVWSDDSVDDILIGLAEVQQPASPAVPQASPPVRSQVRRETTTASFETVPQSSPASCFDDNSFRQSSFTTTDTSQGLPISQASGELDSKSDDTKGSPEVESQVQDEVLHPKSPAQARVSKCRASQGEDAKLPEHSVSSTSVSQEIKSKTSPKPHIGDHHDRLWKTFVYQSPEKQQMTPSTVGRSQSNAEKVDLARAALAKQRKEVISGDQQINSIVTTTSRAITGSEDDLVPNSEDELSEVENASRPSLNLQHFAFAP